MSIGHALFENLIRVDGKVMNPSFRDYKMPLTTDLPKLADFQHSNVITWEPEGPFGAKEAGQGAGTGVIAALANAVYDATGVRLTRLPMTPDRILFALKQKRSGSIEQKRPRRASRRRRLRAVAARSCDRSRSPPATCAR